ncbi:MAG: glycoside hydrolase 43 family protein [Phaeodactylibacter sp.]|nr:glycoside hydrolase 43 family protein [Phaeodactylibacter sp.]MCB9265404.1 glycosyl hydrolase 43 family protein [Lewinellaceae bacterium]MCB9289829.1 glycosyl hydrolase 43 family protein [Lewinellaceae bacterium]
MARLKYWLYLLFSLFMTHMSAQVWNPNLADDQYKNPIIFADYSDPDAIRAGDDFYMVSSSFNCAPALPVLHSKDLVNWEIVNHIFTQQPPPDFFDKPQHGNGVWAPSIRYHDGWFYVFYGDPDFGIYMCKTRDPEGKWEGPHLVKAAKGWIDACPFWDDDGNAYLVHAFAGSRAGIKSILVLHRMASDGSRLLDDGVLVFDGHEKHPTIEGPKMYKRNGYYYIFAPGGGVATGWQTVLRSKNVYGPYEDKIVLHQGNSEINGPHQGAWVELANGESWFLHFQERQPYGRIVHLQPAQWKDNWIVIGADPDGDGTGDPVREWKKPNVGQAYPVKVPQTSDEFNGLQLGRQWQWQANPSPTWAFTNTSGFLRLNPVVQQEGAKNLWDAPNLLLQKMPAPEFTATTKLVFSHHFDGEKTGLIIMGRDYAYLALEQDEGQLFLTQAVCKDAENGKAEKITEKIPATGKAVFLQVKISDGGRCRFGYSFDGKRFTEFGEAFPAREGKWIGAKVGLFCTRAERMNDGGYVDVDWFRITPLEDK